MLNADTAQPIPRHAHSGQIRVPKRFCGPPHSGNGGYTVGLIGKQLGAGAEVTLKRPIPLDETMRVVCMDSHQAVLRQGGADIAVARSSELKLEIPEAVSFSEAASARVRFPGYRSHPFPTCFVCGTGRHCGDGMCLFTGPVAEGTVASSWVPAAEFAAPDGTTSPELVCAALDCPGAWSFMLQYEVGSPCLLGRMTYRIGRPIYAGGRYVVMGWALGQERRKYFCGTAVYDAAGQVCAAAHCTWIQIY
ncbi:MAG: hotdog fold domain-containing protein [Myxococcales bacterium]|jgi:hypothetical protein